MPDAIVPNDAQCRICLAGKSEHEDPLVSACLCRGTIEYVHIVCLTHESRSCGHSGGFWCRTCHGRYEGSPLVDLRFAALEDIISRRRVTQKELAKAYTMLAVALLEAGRPRRAQFVLALALPLRKTGMTQEIFDLARARQCSDVGDVFAAYEISASCLVLRERRLGDIHPSLVSVLNDLAIHSCDVGKFHLAREWLDRAMFIQALAPQTNRTRAAVAVTLSNLAGVFSRLCLPILARKAAADALPVLERHFGPEHKAVALTLGRLGRACVDAGEAEEAMRLLERALAIEQHHFGHDHVELAATLSGLADAFCDVGEFPQAIGAAQRALNITEHSLGAHPLAVAPRLKSLAGAYAEAADLPGARRLLMRALAIEMKHLRVQHPTTVVTAGLLARIDFALAILSETRQCRVRGLHQSCLSPSQRLVCEQDIPSPRMFRRTSEGQLRLHARIADGSWDSCSAANGSAELLDLLSETVHRRRVNCVPALPRLSKGQGMVQGAVCKWLLGKGIAARSSWVSGALLLAEELSCGVLRRTVEESARFWGAQGQAEAGAWLRKQFLGFQAARAKRAAVAGEAPSPKRPRLEF